VVEAQLQSSRAQVDQKKAALVQAQADLDHTTIRAPVNGVVVSRAVDVGQTVAASLQAPTLFTIAEDLTKMQVEVSVDEADIGRIKLEDRSSFTVDSFPGQQFSGLVVQIRKAAQVVQNVVTYTVVVAVDNPGGRLLPGMTANVKMIVAEKPSVLKIPNAALRYRPAGSDAAPATPAGGAAAAEAPPAGGGRQGGGGRPSPEQIRERLVKGLGLSAEQEKKLDPILADSRQQMQALQGLPEQERRDQARKIRETTRTRIREFLTPEQRAKYDESTAASGGETRAGTDPRSGAPGRVYVLDGDKAKPVALTLGISDGTATEILRGDLKEGQEIIIGTAGAPGGRPGTGAPGSGGAPRLRL
jgi:HlyD family secretion protein